jgi:hypothetical protein
MRRAEKNDPLEAPAHESFENDITRRGRSSERRSPMNRS